MAMRGVVYDLSSGEFRVAEDLEKPAQPGDGEILIKMTGAAINPVDSMIPHILQRALPQDHLPSRYRVGVDGMGVVEALGPNVTSPAIGSRVIYHRPTFGTNNHGAFAEYAIMPANGVVEVPESLDDITATAIPCAAWTAYQIVHQKCHVIASDTVLIYGASGGTGSFVTQFCKVKGATTIIAVCSAAKHDYVRSLGATHTIDYRTEDVAARVREITGGEGVRVAVDLVGEDSTAICCSVLRFGGVLCPAATPVNGPDKLFEVMKSAHVHSKALSIAFVGFGGPFLAGGIGAFHEMMECAREATHIIATVPLPVEVTQIVSLNDIPDAIAASAKLGTKGKVIARF